MIPVPTAVRVYLSTGVTDMRRGMPGLSLQVQQSLGRDPHAGHDPFRLFQVTTSRLATRTGLGFDAYADADVLMHPERATSVLRTEMIETPEGAGAAGSEILSAEDLLF